MHLRVGQFVFFDGPIGEPTFGIVTSEVPAVRARVFARTVPNGCDLDLKPESEPRLQVVSEKTFTAARDAGFDLGGPTLGRMLRADRRRAG